MPPIVVRNLFLDTHSRLVFIIFAAIEDDFCGKFHASILSHQPFVWIFSFLAWVKLRITDMGAIWGGFFTPVWVGEGGESNPVVWIYPMTVKWIYWRHSRGGVGWENPYITQIQLTSMIISSLPFVHKNFPDQNYDILIETVKNSRRLKSMCPTPMVHPKEGRGGGGINWLVFGNFTLSDKIPGINWDMACKLARGGWELDNVSEFMAKYGMVWHIVAKYDIVWHSVAKCGNTYIATLHNAWQYKLLLLGRMGARQCMQDLPKERHLKFA